MKVKYFFSDIQEFIEFTKDLKHTCTKSGKEVPQAEETETGWKSVVHRGMKDIGSSKHSSTFVLSF